MEIANYQTQLIQKILRLKDEKKLRKLLAYMNKMVPKPKFTNNDAEEERDLSEFETFDAWDAYLQSMQYVEPDKFFPEWGMTSIEFRRFIWDAEHSGTISYNKFLEEIKTW